MYNSKVQMRVTTLFQLWAVLLFLMNLPSATQIGREWTHYQFYIIMNVVGSNTMQCLPDTQSQLLSEFG